MSSPSPRLRCSLCLSIDLSLTALTRVSNRYDFCAIFDADFHPEADFLLKTVPYLIVRPTPILPTQCPLFQG